MPYEVTADPNAIAYATAADALSAAADRGGGVAFIALSTPEQDQELAAASLDLDTSNWKGERVATTQEREWPRTGTDYSDDAWPGRLVDATIQQAFDRAEEAARIAALPAAPDPTLGALKRKKTGPLEKEWFAPAAVDLTTEARYSDLVQRLIAPLIREATTGQWGTAVTVRSS